jgi:hypothetical protein
MAGTQNQAAARVGGPQGTSGNPSSIQVNGSGTTPLTSSNGPAQTISTDAAVEAYIQKLLKVTTFLGLSVQVHNDVAKVLKKVEDDLDYVHNQQKHGITSIRGKQEQGHGYHSYGCAIDVNYATAPYLMHEAGEKALDAALTPVYNRIAWFVLGRESVIPLDITKLNGAPSDRDRLFAALKEESDAMRKYFGLYMQDPDTFLGPYLTSSTGSANAKKTAWAGVPQGTVPSTTAAFKQMEADWVTLTGRSNGPQVVLKGQPYQNPCDFGMCYPQATTYAKEGNYKTAPDAPFVNKGNAVRDPRNGFMDFDHDVVKALTDNGFTWGAIGFGGESGDVMHFELSALGAKVGADAKRAVDGGS